MAARGQRKTPNMSAGGTAVADPPEAEVVAPADQEIEDQTADDQDEIEDESDDEEQEDESGDDQDGSEGQNGQQSQAMARRDETFGTIVLGGVRVKATYTSIELPEKLSIKNYGRVWQAVDNIRDRSKWWQGDLLNLGADRYGDKYTQALEETGAAYQSVMNVASIARKYTVEQRHAGVSFTHHAVVAAAPAEVRERLLTMAETDRLTTEQLRNEYNEWKAEQAEGGAPATKTPDLAPLRQDGIGVQPVAESDLPDDDPGWECPMSSCKDLIFPVSVAHCPDCGAHYDTSNASEGDILECPHCPESGQVETTVDPNGDLEEGEGADTTAPVSGLVIPPNGVAAPITPGSILSVVSVSEIEATDAADYFGRIPDALPQLMALHHWLGLVLEAISAEPEQPTTPEPAPAQARTVTPVPKPGKPTRKARAAKPAVTVADAEDDDAAETADTEGLPFD